MFPTYEVVFYIFAVIPIASAVMVIVSRNPVRAVLFLVLCFVASAVLWMMLQAEFLSLVLIFVYVGAVMTLFLFVVMMLNVDLSNIKEKFIHYLPLGIIAMGLLVAIMIYSIMPKHTNLMNLTLHRFGPNYNNTKEMGTLLYTNYIFPFEIAGLILLVAIVAAITLAFYGRKPGTKSQKISEQLKANKQDRMRIINMKAEKK